MNAYRVTLANCQGAIMNQFLQFSNTQLLDSLKHAYSHQSRELVRVELERRGVNLPGRTTRREVDTKDLLVSIL